MFTLYKKIRRAAPGFFARAALYACSDAQSTSCDSGHAGGIFPVAARWRHAAASRRRLIDGEKQKRDVGSSRQKNIVDSKGCMASGGIVVRGRPASRAGARKPLESRV
jgi:hypothetical protein